MKRDWARLLTVGGAIMVIQSLLWEYARMKPDNNYLVAPWSARGLDSIHGVVFVVIGLALLAAGLIIGSEWSREPRNSLLAVAGIVVAAVVITAVFASGEDATVGGGLAGIMLGLAIGYTIYLMAQRLTERQYGGDSSQARWLKGGTGALVLAGALVAGSLLSGVMFGSGRELPAPVAVLILMSLIATLVSLMRQEAMAANRMLIATTLVAGTTIGLSGAAIRSTLIRLQAEGGSIPGEYRDTQVTWGYFLANIGVVVFFMGAVMLWARRRDVVQAQQRAAKQRAAAEASAAELAAAG